jgi:hypothetical protein
MRCGTLALVWRGRTSTRKPPCAYRGVEPKKRLLCERVSTSGSGSFFSLAAEVWYRFLKELLTYFLFA